MPCSLSLLTALFVLWDRWRPSRAGAPPLRVPALLLLSGLGILSHVILDLLNNYGVRLLMPFSSHWFYADTLFIVDVWLLLILGAGVYAARRRHAVQPARRALAAAAVYVLLMLVSAGVARQIVLREWTGTHGAPPRSLMVGPLPVTPLSRAIIVDAGDHFETGTFSWIPPMVRMDREALPNRSPERAVSVASQNPYVSAFLRWSRFPYFTVARVPAGHAVTVIDLRFGDRIGRTTVVVPD